MAAGNGSRLRTRPLLDPESLLLERVQRQLHGWLPGFDLEGAPVDCETVHVQAGHAAVQDLPIGPTFREAGQPAACRIVDRRPPLIRQDGFGSNPRKCRQPASYAARTQAAEPHRPACPPHPVFRCCDLGTGPPARQTGSHAHTRRMEIDRASGLMKLRQNAIERGRVERVRNVQSSNTMVQA